MIITQIRQICVDFFLSFLRFYGLPTKFLFMLSVIPLQVFPFAFLHLFDLRENFLN